MPNPTKNLDVLGKLSMKPQKAIGDYICSRQQEHLFVKPPNWDSCGDDIELIALQNDREHKAMVQFQRELLQNSELQATINQHRIVYMCKMMNELKDHFIETNRFLKDCDDKKKFAEAKVLEEKDIHTKLKAVIKKYKSDIEELTKFRDSLKRTVEEFEPYETTIHELLTSYKRFTSVKDCTDRCDALMMAQVEINELKRQKLQEIGELKANLCKLTTEAALTVLGLSNKLSELERGYTAACTSCLKWERILGNVKDYLLESNMAKQRVVDGIRVMYRCLCSRRDAFPNYPKQDIVHQMDFIKNEIQILQAVVRECVTVKKRKST